MPLQNDQRPERSDPPSTGAARPRGAHTPAATARGSPKMSAAACSGRYAESRLLVAAIETHQPADASPRAIASAPRNVVAGEASSAPSAAGTPARISPVADNASTSASGRARSRSVSPASSRASADAVAVSASSSAPAAAEAELDAGGLSDMRQSYTPRCQDHNPAREERCRAQKTYVDSNTTIQTRKDCSDECNDRWTGRGA